MIINTTTIFHCATCKYTCTWDADGLSRAQRCTGCDRRTHGLKTEDGEESEPFCAACASDAGACADPFNHCNVCPGGTANRAALMETLNNTEKDAHTRW